MPALKHLPSPNRFQYLQNDFVSRLGPYIAFSMNADADSVCGQVTRTHDQHGVHFGLLGLLDFSNPATEVLGGWSRYQILSMKT